MEERAVRGLQEAGEEGGFAPETARLRYLGAVPTRPLRLVCCETLGMVFGFTLHEIWIPTRVILFGDEQVKM